MASLRTAFIQTSNSASNPFYSLSGILQIFLPSNSNNEEQKTTKDEKIPLKKEKKVINKRMIQQCEARLLYSQKIYRYINLNINSFCQLKDKQMNDFKDCQNLVHILQIDTQQIVLDSIQTLQSINSIEPSTSGQTKSHFFREEEQYSDVQQISKTHDSV